MTQLSDKNAPDDDLPRLSPSLLRDPTSACPRRIALAHTGRKGDAQSDARWAVSDAVTERARLAQLEHGLPDPAAFEGATFPTTEQERVYAHVVNWYLTHYGTRPGKVVDLGEAQWGRDRPDLGVRLTSRTPLVLETPVDDASPVIHELRILRFGGDPVPDDLLSDTEVRIDVARVAGDVVGDGLRITVADLVRGEHAATEVSVGEITEELDTWIAAEFEAVASVADPHTVRSGAECSWCSYVAGCPAHV